MKEEAERKLKEEEMKQKQNPSLFKFLKSQPEKQGHKELEHVHIATKKFKDYLIKDVEAYKVQVDSIIKFGDIQGNRIVPSSDDSEDQNKQRICDYFKILKNLDPYYGKAEEFSIKYLDLLPKQEEPLSKHNVIIKSKKNKTVFRRKHIIIEDNQKFLLPQHKQSKLLTCRNPFKMDEDLLNYDLDTEDEIEEENGEDLNEEKDMSDDDEEDLEENELAIGFIVEDDYLSISEMNYSESENKDEEMIKADIERRKLMR